jgi:hypothetical protein
VHACMHVRTPAFVFSSYKLVWSLSLPFCFHQSIIIPSLCLYCDTTPPHTNIIPSPRSLACVLCMSPLPCTMPLLPSDANHMGIKLVLWGIYYIGATSKIWGLNIPRKVQHLTSSHLSASHNYSY